MTSKFSIITTCMGRLDHLKRTLPRFVEQPDCEVIVVDYSCPQGTGDYVAEHFPGVKLVRVPGKESFSNWAARNAGAEVAVGEILLFCDADTLLAPDATARISATLPAGAYGHFNIQGTAKFNKNRLRLGNNQLRGFQVIPARMFRQFGGYDDVVVGYAAGADTDLEIRLQMFGNKRVLLDSAIVEDVVEHDNADRMRNHRTPLRTSYTAGMLYRRAKTAMMRMRRTPNLPRPLRENLYNTALRAAEQFGGENNIAKVRFAIDHEKIGMPLQLGYREAKMVVTIEVAITGTDLVDDIPLTVDEQATVKGKPDAKKTKAGAKSG